MPNTQSTGGAGLTPPCLLPHTPPPYSGEISSIALQDSKLPALSVSVHWDTMKLSLNGSSVVGTEGSGWRGGILIKVRTA